MQTNVAVGYAVCYIFGSLGPIIMVSWFLPIIMKWNIRQEAVKLAKQMSGGRAELEPGQFNAVRDIETRIYEVAQNSKAAGKAALAIDKVALRCLGRSHISRRESDRAYRHDDYSGRR